MTKSYSKNIRITFCATLYGFLAICLFFSELRDPKRIMTILIVFSLGAHFIYGCVFKVDTHIGAYTIPAGTKPGLRFLVLLAGLVTLVLVVREIFE